MEREHHLLENKYTSEKINIFQESDIFKQSRNMTSTKQKQGREKEDKKTNK